MNDYRVCGNCVNGTTCELNASGRKPVLCKYWERATGDKAEVVPDMIVEAIEDDELDYVAAGYLIGASLDLQELEKWQAGGNSTLWDEF